MLDSTKSKDKSAATSRTVPLKVSSTEHLETDQMSGESDLGYYCDFLRETRIWLTHLNEASKKLV